MILIMRIEVRRILTFFLVSNVPRKMKLSVNGELQNESAQEKMCLKIS